MLKAGARVGAKALLFPMVKIAVCQLLDAEGRLGHELTQQRGRPRDPRNTQNREPRAAPTSAPQCTGAQTGHEEGQDEATTPQCKTAAAEHGQTVPAREPRAAPTRVPRRAPQISSAHKKQWTIPQLVKYQTISGPRGPTNGNRYALRNTAKNMLRQRSSKARSRTTVKPERFKKMQ
jgi:hypothetical protein